MTSLSYKSVKFSFPAGLKISVGHGHREETTGHSVLSETEVYSLSDPSELVSDRTVALSDAFSKSRNQNVP